LRYLEECVQKDGGIYIKGYENYCTAICLTALLASGQPKYDSIIINANNYLVRGQMNTRNKETAEFDGGIGYNKAGHSDVNNTSYALEALYLAQKRFAPPQTATTEKTTPVLKTSPIPEELNWNAAIDFVTRCQNLPQTNSLKWASADSLNKGGFIYYPGDSKAGQDSTTGRVVYKSYGTASMCGLVSLLFGDVSKNDVRIQAVYDWVCRHYTLEQNPGLGQDGLYFYYHVMAKALILYGAENLQIGKTAIPWRKELMEKLIKIQHNEGFWVNEAGRWWENDPVLATSYALMALEMVAP
jgi:squalene-hopene/tetraprenyl-beta-curcumene cyclase